MDSTYSRYEKFMHNIIVKHVKGKYVDKDRVLTRRVYSKKQNIRVFGTI